MIGKKKLPAKSLPEYAADAKQLQGEVAAHIADAKPEATSRVPAKVAAVMARGGWVTDTEKISVAVLALREIADGAEPHAAALARNAMLVVR